MEGGVTAPPFFYSDPTRTPGLSMRKKADLPTKVCVSCGRPFAWRKKWARVWDEVKYCSDRCRGAKGAFIGKPGGDFSP